MPEPVRYEMRVLGTVDPAAVEPLTQDMAVHEDHGVTVLSATLDQADLHSLLSRIEDQGLELFDLHRTGLDGT